ncbi:MAG: ABC transporter substrate-binding protein [Minicystis sp.]
MSRPSPPERLLACAVLLGAGGLFAGCDNSPYPASERGNNTFYSTYMAPPAHLDPARGDAAFGSLVSLDIYEPPLQYHFLKRPFELVPLTAAGEPARALFDHEGRPLPDDAPADRVGRAVYTVRLRPDIFYRDHPCFALDEAGEPRYRALRESDLAGLQGIDDLPWKGTRALAARDYVWQVKRLAHPAVQSPAFRALSAYIEGLSELGERLTEELERVRAARRAAAGAGYNRERDERDHPIFLDLDTFDLPGARVVDPLTFTLTLKESYPQLRYWLSSLYFAPVPREAEELYAQGPLVARNITLDTSPVGTGPYALASFVPDREIVLTRNPRFRGEPYPAEGAPGDEEAGLLRDAGQTMPFIDRAVYKLEREHIPRWNKFLEGYYDTSRLISDVFDHSLVFTPSGGFALTEEMRARGMQVVSAVSPLLIYFAFNLRDQTVGGLSPAQKKLRQAISIAIDTEELNAIFQNGRDVPAHGPVPPGTFGHEPDHVNPVVFEPGEAGAPPHRRSIEQAKRLLTEAGYPGGAGPDGRPLSITFDTTARAVDKPFLDWVRRQFDKIGIDLRIRTVDQARLQERVARGDFQLVRSGAQLPYPDPEGAFLPFYGQSTRGFAGNVSGYESAELDALYRRMRSLPDGEEREALIHRMTRILEEDCPWIWDVFLRDPVLYHAWTANLKPLTITGWWGGAGTLKYRRVDVAARERAIAAWNQPVRWPGLALLGLLALSLTSLRRAQRGLERRSAR